MTVGQGRKRQSRAMTLWQLYTTMKSDTHYTAYDAARLIDRTPQYTRQLLNQLWNDGLVDAIIHEPDNSHRLGYCAYIVKSEDYRG